MWPSWLIGRSNIYGVLIAQILSWEIDILNCQSIANYAFGFRGSRCECRLVEPTKDNLEDNNML